MDAEIFLDGVSEITVTGTTVRIDTFTVSPTDKDERGHPKPVPRQRIIMTLEGFMNTRDLFERVARELVSSGAVRRTEPTSATGSDPIRPRGSPNFPGTHG
jgi:hypothetical protein